MQKIEEKVTQLLEKKITNLGYELYDVEYLKQGKNYILRIYIGNEKGITLEDCEKVSRQIEVILDDADIIKEQYMLEVSSTGIEKILRKDKHIKDNILKEIEVSLYTKVNNKKTYEGTLISYDENNITIIYDNTKYELERKNISQIKLKYNWGK